MPKLVLCASLLFLSLSAFASESDFFGDECNSNPMVLPFVLAANSADAVLCTNEMNSDNMREIALKCFLGKRPENLIKTEPELVSSEVCQMHVFEKCSEITKCHERDDIFGGYKELCGHLGTYLDFLWRIKGVNPMAFTESDGKALCKELSRIGQ